MPFSKFVRHKPLAGSIMLAVTFFSTGMKVLIFSAQIDIKLVSTCDLIFYVRLYLLLQQPQ